MTDEAIRAFWKLFASTSEALVHPADSEAMNRLLKALREVDERFYFHVAEHDEGVDLILSAEGHCDALPLLGRVRMAAPTAPRWTVIAAFDGDLVIGRRNPALFPADANGDVLFRMARSGDNLCAEREMDFSLVFRSAQERREFLESLPDEGLEGRPVGSAEAPWDVLVSRVMLPTHANITQFEKLLELLALPFGGRNDGWGSFRQP